MCVYMVCRCGMYVCMHVYKYAPEHAHTEAQKFNPGVFFYCSFSLIFLRQGLSLNVELTISGRLAGKETPRIHMALPTPNIRVTVHAATLTGVLGTHTSSASTLPPDPCPHSLKFTCARHKGYSTHLILLTRKWRMGEELLSDKEAETSSSLCK